MIDRSVYEAVIKDVLDAIAEMRSTGDYDENTLESLEWRLSPPAEEVCSECGHVHDNDYIEEN